MGLQNILLEASNLNKNMKLGIKLVELRSIGYWMILKYYCSLNKDLMFRLNYHRILLSILLLMMVNLGYAQDQNEINNIREITGKILDSSSPDQKLIHNTQLINALNHHLNKNAEKITPIDSTGLLLELISKDQKIQLISWAINFDDHWEYFSFLKCYNELKEYYQVHELIPTDFPKKSSSESYNEENWPAAVYYRMIETEYNKRKYYSLFGWLANEDQTAFKIIEVMTIGKSGKPYFGKTNYFSKDKSYQNRMLFAYSSQSKFQLAYGEYLYSTRKWNAKKRKYDQTDHQEMLIVFDHLIPLYPDLKDISEFLVPVGNSVDAFYFEKGKWRYISDIDARNIKRKDEERMKPGMNLFENNE